jgi:hypothetical protein
MRIVVVPVGCGVGVAGVPFAERGGPEVFKLGAGDGDTVGGAATPSFATTCCFRAAVKLRGIPCAEFASPTRKSARLAFSASI